MAPRWHGAAGDGAQIELDPDVALTLDLRRRERAGQRLAEALARRRPILEVESDPQLRRLRAFGQRGRDRVLPSDAVDHDGLELTAGERHALIAQEGHCVLRPVERHTERPEQRNDHILVGGPDIARGVGVGGVDPVQLAQGGDTGVEPRHCSEPRMSRMPLAGMSTQVGRVLTS